MKQLRSTFFLLLVAAVIGGYIYFNERGPTAQEGATVLLRTRPDQVQQLRLQTAGRPAVVLQRDGTSWKVAVEAKKGTPTAPADPGAVSTLLDLLQLIQSNAGVVAGKPAEYGLDKPVSTMVVDGRKLEFGNKPPFDQGQVYARLDGKIALIPATLADNAARDFASWRDKSVLRFKSEDVTSFEVRSPHGETAFTKQEDRWHIEKPVAFPAAATTVDGFLSTLSTAQSTAWLDETGTDLKRWGLDQPQASVSVGAQVLKIGHEVDGGYAAQNSSASAVFKLPDSVFSLVTRPLKDWRNKKVADFGFEEVSSVTVISHGKSQTLQKRGEKWQLAGGADDPKVNEAAVTLIAGAQNWIAQDFVDHPGAPAHYGLDRPELEVDIKAATDIPLKIGRKDGRLYADNGSGTLFVLSSRTLDGVKSALDTVFPISKQPSSRK